MTSDIITMPPIVAGDTYRASGNLQSDEFDLTNCEVTCDLRDGPKGPVLTPVDATTVPVSASEIDVLLHLHKDVTASLPYRKLYGLVKVTLENGDRYTFLQFEVNIQVG